jgi:uncharacterized RDD family membrane protein YckC
VARGEIRNMRARESQGLRAGFASRIVAGAIDGAVIFGTYIGVLFVIGLLRFLFDDESLHLPRPHRWVTIVVVIVIGVLELSTAWSGSGRTVGDDVVGLRVVTASGGPLRPRRAFVRAVLVMLTGGLVLLTVLVSKRNNGVHDWLCRTTVIYEWRPRPHSSENRPPG